MEAEFIASVKRLARERGREVLTDAAKCKALLADYTQNEFKKERHLLLVAIEVGAGKAIANAGDLAVCKKQQIHFLKEEHFIEEGKAVEVIELLALILRGDRNRSTDAAEIYKPPQTPLHSPSAQASPPIAATAFRDPTRLTLWLKYCLYASIIIGVIAVFSNALQLQLLSDFKRGVYSSEALLTAAAGANDKRQQIVGLCQIVIGVTTMILFAMWIYRANFNSRALGARNMKFSPGWSVGYYFIPIANLWRPYQAMKEIWQTSKNPAAWENEKRGAILPWWWFFFLVEGILNNASFRMSMSAKEIHELIAATGIMIVADAVSIPSAIIALLLVGEIHKMQMSHLKQKPGVK
jgi:hypothetical protein